MLTQTNWPKRLRLVTAVVMMSLALFVQPAYAQEPDWTWQNPLPQGNSLLGVWGSSGSDVFAVGGSGTILHYDGSSWSSMSSGTSNHLGGVWGSSGSDVFAVGEGGTVLHYSGDGGEIFLFLPLVVKDFAP
jgi:hypothetical protein